MRYLLTILFIYLIALDCDAQHKVRGRDLAQSAYDSIATVIQDSIAFPVDTTALKLLNMDKGRVAFTRGLDATSNPNLGGGQWNVIDSIYAETFATLGYAKSHVTDGFQWERDALRQSRLVYPEWWGAIPDDGSDTDDRAAIQAAIDLTEAGGGSGRQCIIGDGIYSVTKVPGTDYCLSITSGAQIMGYGGEPTVGGSVIRMLAGQDSAYVFATDAYVNDNTSWTHRAAIDRLNINPNEENQSGFAGAIASWYLGETTYLRSIYISHYKGIGIYISHTAPGIFENISIFPGDSAVWADTSGASTENCIGIKIANVGNSHFKGLSGDKNNPMMQIENYGQSIVVENLKIENDAVLTGVNRVGGFHFKGPLTNPSSLVVIGFSCSMGSPTRGSFIAIDDTLESNVPTIVLMGGTMSNVDTLIANRITSTPYAGRQILASSYTNFPFIYYATENPSSSMPIYLQNDIHMRNSQGIFMADTTLGVVEALTYSQAGQYLQIRSPRNTIKFELYDGVDIADLGTIIDFYKPTEAEGTFKTKAGLYIGGTGAAKLDSAKVVADTLKFLVGGVWYNAVKE